MFRVESAVISGLTAILFIVCIALGSQTRASHDEDRVVAAFALTGSLVGLLLTAAHAILFWRKPRWFIVAWVALCFISLWFLAGACGVWANGLARKDNRFDHGITQAQIGVGIATAFFLIVTIVLAVHSSTSDEETNISEKSANPEKRNKVPYGPLRKFAIALFLLTFLFFMVCFVLAATDVGGVGNENPYNENYRTSVIQGTYALVSCVMGMGGSMLSAILFLRVWPQKSHRLRPAIISGYVFVCCVLLFLLGGCVGIWAHKQALDSNPDTSIVWSSQWRAEFAFEIIASMLWIICTTILFTCHTFEFVDADHSESSVKVPAESAFLLDSGVELRKLNNDEEGGSERSPLTGRRGGYGSSSSSLEA